ncbi:MAG: cation-translocating P-type ATPase [Chloroflexota bacterium]
MTDRQPYEDDASEALRRFGGNAQVGLTTAEAESRLRRDGPNELLAAAPVSPWTILLEQFKNVLIIILLCAIVLSAFLGHTIEALAIAVIVLFAAALGFYQEYRAERSLEALRELSAPSATVLRDGEEKTIPARDLVTGDVIYLRTGDKIPADGRLLESVNLKCDEAALTGESLPVEKQTAPLPSAPLSVADRTNMIFAGTTVTYGRGRAVVVATAMKTEFGQIAESLQKVESGRTPLQQNLDRVGSILARSALGIVVLVAALGLLRGQPLLDMIIFSIALAVAVVPEALPAVVTISLAIGVQRMARRNALVRRLPAVETLGSVSVICSDKTGTLTRDQMTVRKIFVAGHTVLVSGSGYDPQGDFTDGGQAVEPRGPLALLLQAGVLASDAGLVRDREHGWKIKGDPTEAALVVAAAKAGFDKSVLDAEFPRVQEIPFTSESKRMTTLHAANERTVAYAKGAPEVILGGCARFESDGGAVSLGGETRDSILRCARQMAGEALRVLAVAYKPDAELLNAEREMVFLGLVGMIDPPRPEAKTAIETCARAGIRTMMITGDHPVTAAAVARELGMLAEGKVVTGAEIDKLSTEALEREVGHLRVVARVSPQHKLSIVTALQNHGQLVAMTGDGINDAPALKKADIGVAMGITGTDVTKEAADMTLTDDNFASIVAAVEEGRAVFENIKKYLMFLLSSNLGEILLLAGATLLGWPLPLTAVQILYINLATDGLPALALAVDPHEADLMWRKPRNQRRGIFTRPVVALMLTGGIWSALVNLTMFRWALHSGRGLEEATTMVFAGLALIEFFKAYNYRSDRHSVLLRPFSNKWLNLAVTWELILLAVVVYAPFMQRPLRTFSLSPTDWAILFGVALSIFPVLESMKWLERRGWFGASSEGSVSR